MEKIHKYPIVRNILEEMEDLEDAPFHPLQHTDHHSDRLWLKPLKHLKDVEGTFLRGRLLYNKGGIEFGIGRLSDTNQELVMIIHVGNSVCGHPSIVHGGMIAALFDDTMGYLFFALSNGEYTGFTAYLNVTYVAKMELNAYGGKTVAICTRVTKRDGRKVFLEAEAYDAECECNNVSVSPSFRRYVGETSKLFAKAEALFVIPRQDAMQ